MGGGDPPGASTETGTSPMSLVSAAGGRNTRSSRSQAINPKARDANAKVTTAVPAFPRGRGAQPTLGKAEHIERPSLGGLLRQVAHHIDEPAARGRVARIEVARHDGAGPAADPGEDGHILPAVWTAIRGGLTD